MRFSRDAGCFLGLLYCLMMPAYGHSDSAYSHNTDDIFTDRSGWMRTIRDDVQLSEMALPGTHDSATFDISILPIVQDVVQTQVLSFDKQLEYGIRVFDLRIHQHRDDLGLYHGPISLNKGFDLALEAIRRFLTDNPSETVLFRVKEEFRSGTHSTQSLKAVFDNYIAKFSGVYLRAHNNKLTLGEARGKFVVLSNNSSLNSYGLSYSSFDIQDDYEMSSNWALHDKHIKIKKHLHRAATGNRDAFYVNYLSASHRSFPYFVASGHSLPGTSAARLATGLVAFGKSDIYKDFPRTGCFIGICTISFEGTNMLTRDDIHELNKKSSMVRTVGIVMADFPGDSLISNIIGNNYRQGHNLGKH